MAADRIYVITPEAGTNPRLVRATHPANALRHVALGSFTVAVASQETLVQLIAGGVKVENIGSEQQELPTT